jgi:phosphoglycolate phosphatase
VAWTKRCIQRELRGVFDGSRTADETAGKPHPLMLQELMAEFDVPPERLLMIGDTTHDLQMALNGGLCQRGRELRRPRA